MAVAIDGGVTMFYGDSTSVMSSTFVNAWTLYPDGTARHRGQCGKACYGSKGAADRSVKTMRRNGKDQRYRGYLHSYICTICRVWHVGHTDYED